MRKKPPGNVLSFHEIDSTNLNLAHINGSETANKSPSKLLLFWAVWILVGKLNVE